MLARRDRRWRPLRTGEEAVAGAYRCLCFFFQAEDGIRDVAVTGVQTCALPISMAPSRSRATSLYWVTLAIRSPRWIAVNRCTRVAETAIPTLPPSWRIRLKRDRKSVV